MLISEPMYIMNMMISLLESTASLFVLHHLFMTLSADFIAVHCVMYW